MPVSDKLAYEIYTIVLAHWIAIMAVFSSIAFIWIKAKPSALKTCFLSVAGLIALWLIAKIFKTVSPNLALRWFFVVVQYFGVQYFGVAFIFFAWCYNTGKLPNRLNRILLLIPPTLGFISVATNPLHMLFYSMFDFYKDKFGPLFLPLQAIQYLYLIIGVMILMVSYRKEPKKDRLGRFFAMLSLLVMGMNGYYIAFKFDIVDWYFNFPVFDITPLVMSAALIFFLIAAYNRKFLDLSPISISQTLSSTTRGLLFVYPDETVYDENLAFKRNFPQCKNTRSLSELISKMPVNDVSIRQEMIDQIMNGNPYDALIVTMESGKQYKIQSKVLNRQVRMVHISDVTNIEVLRHQIDSQNTELIENRKQLEKIYTVTKNMSILKQKRAIAQDVHDILGHSLTVVIGSLELVALDAKKMDVKPKLTSICEMIMNSVADLKNALSESSVLKDEPSLIQLIDGLSNDNIFLDFSYQGNPVELSTKQTEAFYRLCQEAITNAIRHGKAKNIHIVLRYSVKKIDMFIVDDGAGCKEIVSSYGLTGIIDRFSQLNGTARYHSDGESGFNLYASLPL